MSHTKGFVTVATGDEKYYQIAANLYLSYKKRGCGNYPFALICDRENEYTALFEDVVLVSDFQKSTIDKLLMYLSPYEESIFIDADTLILKPIDDLWEIFQDQAPVCAFGCKLPLDSQKGWFTYEGCGKYQSRISFLISMNGGIYYFRKCDLAESVFAKAATLVGEYSTIDFKYFSTPADEPVMALSMALHNCAPCDVRYDMIVLPAEKAGITTDCLGNVYAGSQPSPAKLIHFSTRRTELSLYQYLAACNRNGDAWRSRKHYLQTMLRCGFRDLRFQSFHFAGAVLRRVGLGDTIRHIKKILR